MFRAFVVWRRPSCPLLGGGLVVKCVQVVLEYCGCSFKHPVVGLRSLVEVTYMVAVKSCLRKFSIEQFVPLWQERDLAPAVWLQGEFCTNYGAEITSGMVAAREAANLLVQGGRSASAIKTCFKKNSRTLHLHDQFFGICFFGGGSSCFWGFIVYGVSCGCFLSY